MDAVEEIKLKVAAGNKPTVPESLEKYICIKATGGERPSWEVVCDYAKWQTDVDAKGFCSIASSQELGAAKTNRIYHLRDASETQYMILKNELRAMTSISDNFRLLQQHIELNGFSR